MKRSMSHGLLDGYDITQDGPGLPAGKEHTGAGAFRAAQATPAALPFAADEPIDESKVVLTYTAVARGRIELPEGSTFDQIIKVGGDLYLVQPDGSLIKIVNGAAVPVTLVAGGIEIPAEALSAALEGAEDGVPTAGPEAGGPPQSSGNNFSVDPGGIGDPLNLIGLLQPTTLTIPETPDEDNNETLPLDGLPLPVFIGFTGLVEEEHNSSIIRVVGPNSGNEDTFQGNTGEPDLDTDDPNSSLGFDNVTLEVIGDLSDPSLYSSPIIGTPTFTLVNVTGQNAMTAGNGGTPLLLMSQGQQVILDVTGNVLTGYVEDGTLPGGFDSADRKVFRFELNPDGTFNFTLFDQTDDVFGDNIEDILGIDLSGIVRLAAQNGTIILDGIVINVIDDTPITFGEGPILTADEDDIVTLHSQGSDPFDGQDNDGSTTGPFAGSGLPATISGNLTSLVSVGADEHPPQTDRPMFGFASNAISYMEGLGLFSKHEVGPADENGIALTYEIDTSDPDLVVLRAIEPDIAPGTGTGNVVFELSINQFTGDFVFRLFDELVHELGDGENTALRSGQPDPVTGQATIPWIDFGQIVTFSDYDGDTITLDSGFPQSPIFAIEITDDVPWAVINKTLLGLVQHDETPGLDDFDLFPFDPDMDTDDQAVVDLFASIPDAEKGDDPDVDDGDKIDGAIGYARSFLPVVTSAATVPGADAPLSSETFSLQIAGNPESGLTVTDGSAIVLEQLAGDLVVGRVDGGTFDGQIAFAVHLDGNGFVSTAQYLSLLHPDMNSNDEHVTLGDNLEAVLTITDSDGDTDTDSVAIGERIRFDDDGPELVNGAMVMAEIDEPGVSTVDPDTAVTFLTPTSDGRFFGLSVAIDGNLVLIGAFGDIRNSGQAHLFDTDGNLLQTFNNPTPTSDDRFGLSVAIEGNQVLVGVPGDDNGGFNVGRAHLFDAATGNLLQTFDDPTPTTSDQFGQSVAIDGNLVLIGAPLDDTGSAGNSNIGQAHLFDATTGALLHTFDNPAPSVREQFGFSVAIDGNLVLIGAPGFGSRGQAHLFDATTGNLLQTFDDPTPTTSDQFGFSVAIDGNLVLIGDPRDDTADTNSGQAHLFDTDGNLLRTFDNPSPAVDDNFGQSIAIHGNLVLIGAWGDDDSGVNAGRAYLFDATTGALLETFDDPGEFAFQFGESVAIGDSGVVVGEPFDGTGQAHFFPLGMEQVVLSLDGLADFGADGPGAAPFALKTFGAQDLAGVESGGEQVKVVSDGTTLTGFIDDGSDDNALDDDDTVIFTAKLNGDEITFTLLDELDHGGQDILELDIGQFINAIDADGDAAMLTGQVVVKVVEGVPAAGQTSVALDEDDIPGAMGNEGGTDDLDPTPGPAMATGTLDLDFGPDGPGTVDFAAMDGVTQIVNGVDVTFSWDAANNILTANDGEEDVFTVEVTDTSTGDFKVSILNSLRHHQDADADDVETDAQFDLTYTVRDSDGSTADGSLSLTVDDDTPVLTGQMVMGTVSESDLGGGPVTETLDDPAPAAGHNFGGSVAISGDLVLVGAAPSDLLDPGVGVGQAHLFDADGNLLRTFDDPTPTDHDTFGASVAIDGNRVLIGAPRHDTNSLDTGQAHLFDTDGNELLTFDDPTDTFQDLFGTSVAIGGNLVLIGAPGDDTNGTNVGQAHLFDATTGAPLHTFEDPTPTPNGLAGDNFGQSVAIDGNLVLIGAPNDDTNGARVGQVHLFDVTDPTNPVPLHTFDDPTPTTEDRFGFSVAIDGNLVLIGAWGDDTAGFNVGQAHLFDVTNPTNPALLHTFDNPFPADIDHFGFSVAIDGNRVLIGASRDDTNGTDVGRVYLFDTDGNLLETFDDPTPTMGDQFGQSVAIGGNGVVIGAPNDDSDADDAGQAHLFTIGADPISTTVDLSSLVSFGADGPAAVPFALKSIAVQDFGAPGEFEVGGAQVKLFSDGDTLTGFLDDGVGGDNGALDGGDTVVFTLTIADNGTATYTQFEAFDVPQGETQLQLDFGQFVQAIDGDGDTVMLEEDRFVIKVDTGAPAPNQPPMAVDDTIPTDEDTAVTSSFSLLDNDSDADGDVLNIIEVNGAAFTVDTPVALGSGAFVTIHADGTFTYDPNGQFESLNDGDSAADSFAYTISDGNGGTAEATATVSIDGATDGPTAPTVIVDIVDDNLSFSDNSSLVTFEFSEEVTGLAVHNIGTTSGSLSDFTRVDGDSYTATFIADPGINRFGAVNVFAGTYTDLDGNPGERGSDIVVIDTTPTFQKPMVTLSFAHNFDRLGMHFQDGDIFQWDGATFTEFFDESEFDNNGGTGDGLGSGGVNGGGGIDGVHVFTGNESFSTVLGHSFSVGDILFSVAQVSEGINGPGGTLLAARDGDVVLWDASEGYGTIIFEDFGFGNNPVGNVNALSINPANGNLVFSTSSDLFNVDGSGSRFTNGDLIEFDGVSFSQFFDEGSGFGGGGFSSDENIDAVHVLGPNEIIFSVSDQAIFQGVSASNGDLIHWNGTTATKILSGGLVFGASNFDIDALDPPKEVLDALLANVVRHTPVTAQRQVDASLSGNQFVFAFIAAAFALESVTSISIDLSAQAATIDPQQLGVALGDGSAVAGVSATVSDDGNTLTVTLPDGAVSEGDELVIDVSTTDGDEIDPEGVSFLVAFNDGSSLEGTYEPEATGDGSESGAYVASVEAEVEVGQTITGTDNDDILVGGDGDDIIFGGAGDDIIDGGAGRNTLTGGEGADTFVLGHIDIADIITDYDYEEGDDIDLSGLLGDSGAGAEAGNLGNFVRVMARENDGASLEVDTTGGGNGFAKVATLQGIGAGDTVRVILSDDGGSSSSGDIFV